MSLIKTLIIGSFIVALLYGVYWVLTTFTFLEIFTWVFIAVALGTSLFMLMALMRGQRANG